MKFKMARREAATYIAIILLVPALALSCGGSGHPPSSDAKPAPQTQAANGVTSATYHGVGTVESVDQTKGTLQINHGEIKGFMPAMTMDYHPRDISIMKTVKAGDRIEFTLEDAAGIITITEIKKL